MKRAVILFLVSLMLWPMMAMAEKRVNDDTTGIQTYPDVAMNAKGDVAITWSDSRSGVAEVYYQLYDSAGNPKKPNVGLTASSPIEIPHVAMSPSGQFVITWNDLGNHSNYFQLFNAEGESLTAVIQIMQGNLYYMSPSVAMDYDGNFNMTWVQGLNSPPEMWAQQYSDLGNPLGSSFKVNRDTIYNMTGPPVSLQYDLACDSAGNFVIVWQDQSRAEIYIRFLDSSGTPGDSIFTIDNTYTPVWPRVVLNEQGAWLAWRELYRIWVKGLNSQGVIIKPKFTVSGSDAFELDITLASSGRFVVVWAEKIGNDYDIYAQRCDYTGNKIGGVYMVNNDNDIEEYYPAVSANNQGITFVWMANNEIYTRQVDWVYPQKRGDANNDSKVNVTDVIYLINYLFKGGPVPQLIMEAGDAKCDGNTNITDVIYIINYLFKGGPAPCPTERW